MRRLIRSTSGFTFVETIIAFSIIGIFLALAWATVSFLLMKTGEQIVRTRGHFLAVEGIEKVKQIRQTMVNQDRLNGFYNSIGSKTGDYVLGENAGLFTLTPGSSEVIHMDEEPYTDYCRTVTFEGDEVYLKKVTAEVRWGDAIDCRKGDKLIVYSTYLADMSQ